MSTTILSLALFCAAAAPPVETSSTAETMLYVRTTPAGAEILLDGKSLGTAPGLFKVPPGVRRIVVELDRHEPDGGEVTIKAGHIRRLEFKLKRRPGRAAEGATDSVADVLNRWQAALTELDFKKLEALFLPPDDTPAGKARRKDLEDTKEYFLQLKAAGVTTKLWCVGFQHRHDGKDRIVSLTMVSRITSPAGEVEKGERAYQLRITPTPDGWKIAEMKLLDQPKVTPAAPAPRAERPRYFVRIVVGRDALSFEGEETTWALLPALLEKVPNRQSTALELAVASDDMTLKEKNDATGRASALARRFGFEHLSYIGVQPLGSKGSPAQIFRETEAPSVTQAPKKVHLPDADTPGAGVVLDLASGQILSMGPAVLDPDAPRSNVDTTVFTRQGKGDLMFDRVLGCLRGAKAMWWDGKRFVPLAAKEQVQDVTAYSLPEVPCRLLITTAEQKHFDVAVLAVTKDGGIDLEYRPADPAVVPQNISAGSKTEKRDSE